MDNGSVGVELGRSVAGVIRELFDQELVPVAQLILG
jgi:hypothetical protein